MDYPLRNDVFNNYNIFAAIFKNDLTVNLVYTI